MKIVLSIDGTKHSEEAIKAVLKFNLCETDELKIITVVDLAVPMAIDLYAGYLHSSTEIENIAKENANLILENSKKQIIDFIVNKNLLITTEVLIGSPESRIVETAEDFGADLIVVGSHGYNTWERLLLGSVSDSVVHHAPCSVLVVRGDKNNK